MSSHHCPSNAAEDGTAAVAAAPASSALATPASRCVWTSCVRTGTTSLSDAAPAYAAVIAADVGGGVAASAGTGAAGGGTSVCTATLADGGGGAADPFQQMTALQLLLVRDYLTHPSGLSATAAAAAAGAGGGQGCPRRG